jgi:multidrug efflux pump subunit AcrB
MNPIIFALRHPITIMVLVAGVVLASVLAVLRMKIDVFPQLNLPVIYVAQPYGGMDPKQMEGLITNYYEYHFLYISGIHHVESKNIQGVALMKLFFHPGTDMAQAMAETIQYVSRSKAFMPPGTVSPFVMRFDTGSVPVGYLVFSSKNPKRTIGEIQDAALFKVRPMFAALPGVSAPPPFGGNQRTVVVRVDPDKLRSYNLSPQEVIAALSAGNTISPSGNIRIKDRMPIVPTNALVRKAEELGSIPIRPGANVYLKDLAEITGKATDIPSGYALVNGRRAVYILVTRRADASTLSVINAVRAKLPDMQAVLPDDIEVSLEFDQSPYVTGAMFGVGMEALLGAFLTGLMVLVFLRDWRSVIVVVLNIPFALLGSVVGLWLTGHGLNLMTLGGLALAVGILVDEATVEVENIHTQFEHTPNIARAVRLGNAQTAVPRLLAMLCILAVFLPSFFMQGAAQALFVPLSLAVGFAMISSYLLSSTFVPVLSVWLLRHYHAPQETGRWFSFNTLRDGYGRLVGGALRLRWILLPAYLVLAGLVIWLAGINLGREIFPKVDAGQFQVRLRAATGTRIERTEELTVAMLDLIKKKVGPDNVAISVGYVGLIPSTYPINAIYLWMSGPEEAVLRVALKPGSGFRVEELKQQLREELSEGLAQWLRQRMTLEGFTTAEIDERIAGLKLSFEPADIVNEVMSFGSPTPVEVVVSGPNYADNRAYAAKLKDELARVPTLQDLQYGQSTDYPTLEVYVDRELASRAGVLAEQVAISLVAATSSSRFLVPNFWPDDKTGIGYQVQVEIPIERMNSTRRMGQVPIQHTFGGKVLLEDVGQVREGTTPGEYDRYNMRRFVSLTANVQGEDLGRAARWIGQAMQAAGKPPTAVQVDVRGQVEPMNQMFTGLGIGLALAWLVIFLLLTAYFQSLRLALISITTAPAVIAGVILMLLGTGTTLNIQSFMGAIMAVGVATANAILLVTFAEQRRREGAAAFEAAVDGARLRMRPILMTSCAMIAGMFPMALGLGEGGEQAAPLARAVIGGLLAATAATLLLLPCAFAVVQGRASKRSVSLDPDDPESAYHEQGQAAQAPG